MTGLIGLLITGLVLFLICYGIYWLLLYWKAPLLVVKVVVTVMVLIGILYLLRLIPGVPPLWH